MIKECPKCQKTYTDTTLSFCLEDGTRLVAPSNNGADSMPTVFLPSSDSIKTKIHVEPKKKSAVKYLSVYGAIAVMFLLAAGVLGFMFLQNISKGNKNSAKIDIDNSTKSPVNQGLSENKAVSENNKTTDCSLSESDKNDIAKIQFATASNNLPPESMEILKNISGHLKAFPKNCYLEVGVHTDNVGDTTINTELSMKRSLAIGKYLIEMGFDRNRLSYQGYGSSQPIADNSTEAGRRQNRRVEFKLFTKDNAESGDILDLNNADTVADLQKQGVEKIVPNSNSKNSKPNPFVLIVEIRSNGDLFLNKQAQGNILDKTRLLEKLREGFSEREKAEVFKEGTNTVEKTVFIETPAKVNRDIFNKTLNLIKDSGANPIYLYSKN